MTDPVIANKALEIKQIEKEIVARIDEIVREDRLKTEEERNRESQEHVLRQKEGIGASK